MLTPAFLAIPDKRHGVFRDDGRALRQSVVCAFRDLITPIFPRWRLSPPVALRRRHSRAGAREKIEIAGIGETPQRHSREGGNPFLSQAQRLKWVPAFAGPALRRNCTLRSMGSGIIGVIRFREGGASRHDG